MNKILKNIGLLLLLEIIPLAWFLFGAFDPQGFASMIGMTTPSNLMDLSVFLYLILPGALAVIIFLVWLFVIGVAYTRNNLRMNTETLTPQPYQRLFFYFNAILVLVPILYVLNYSLVFLTIDPVFRFINEIFYTVFTAALSLNRFAVGVLVMILGLGDLVISYFFDKNSGVRKKVIGGMIIGLFYLFFGIYLVFYPAQF